VSEPTTTCPPAVPDTGDADRQSHRQTARRLMVCLLWLLPAAFAFQQTRAVSAPPASARFAGEVGRESATAILDVSSPTGGNREISVHGSAAVKSATATARFDAAEVSVTREGRVVARTDSVSSPVVGTPGAPVTLLTFRAEAGARYRVIALLRGASPRPEDGEWHLEVAPDYETRRASVWHVAFHTGLGVSLLVGGLVAWVRGDRRNRCRAA
jgi:hypothetical protein